MRVRGLTIGRMASTTSDGVTRRSYLTLTHKRYPTSYECIHEEASVSPREIPDGTLLVKCPPRPWIGTESSSAYSSNCHDSA